MVLVVYPGMGGGYLAAWWWEWGCKVLGGAVGSSTHLRGPLLRRGGWAELGWAVLAEDFAASDTGVRWGFGFSGGGSGGCMFFIRGNIFFD